MSPKGNIVALLKLRIVPDPFLRQKAKRVRFFNASLHRLADNMVETMIFENGVGLAANQVGVLQRVAVIQMPEDEEATVLINPEIVNRKGEREVDEGCLSVPGYRGTLPRFVTIKVKAQDRYGKQVRIKAEGLLAQALEHEVDHLNGTLYIDHLDSHDKLYKIEPEPTETTKAGEALESVGADVG
jgi:peptide deformylase